MAKRRRGRRFRPRDGDVWAVQWSGGNAVEVEKFVGRAVLVDGDVLVIDPAGDGLRVPPEGWVVQNEADEFGVVPEGEFQETYAEVEDP